MSKQNRSSGTEVVSEEEVETSASLIYSDPSLNKTEGAAQDPTITKCNDKKADNMRCTFPAIVAFILLGAIWGSAFIFIRFGVDEKTGFPALTLVALRLLSASVMMIILLVSALIFSKTLRQQVIEYITPDIIVKMVLLGIFNNIIPFVLVGWAEQSINIGVVSILDASIPLFGIVLAHFFLQGEGLSFMKVLGLLIGFGGVILVCFQKVTSGEQLQFNDFFGYILVTLASASYAVASVIAKKYLSMLPGLMCATGQIVSAALLTTVLALIVDNGFDSRHFSFYYTADYMAWISIAYLAVFSTVVAYILYFYLIRTIGSTKQTMVGYLLPVFGVFEGALFLREWAGVSWFFIASEVIGAVMICAGIAIVTFDIGKVKAGAKKVATYVSPTNAEDLENALNQEDESQSLVPGKTKALKTKQATYYDAQSDPYGSYQQ